MGNQKKNNMSKTFTKIINIIFFSYFLMATFSSIKLSIKKGKDLSGKTMINNDKITPPSKDQKDSNTDKNSQKNINDQILQDIESAQNLMKLKNMAKNSFKNLNGNNQI